MRSGFTSLRRVACKTSNCGPHNGTKRKSRSKTKMERNETGDYRRIVNQAFSLVLSRIALTWKIRLVKLVTEVGARTTHEMWNFVEIAIGKESEASGSHRPCVWKSILEL